MEQLIALQRKNAVLRVLENSWTGAAPPPLESQAALAEALLALCTAFGEEFLRRMQLLADALPKLREGGLVTAAAAAVPSGGTVTKAAELVACVPSPLHCSVTLEGMDLAQSALEDFVSSYFMFHDLDADSPADIFRYLPVLAFVESHIYGLDQANEDHLGSAVHSDCKEPPPGEEPFGPLCGILRERGLLTARLESELRMGARFWALERQICGTLERGAPVEVSHAQEALRLKSFDYRVMNLLLYGLRHVEPDEKHLAFLNTSEVLVELGDDLADYADDMEANSFNIYRCYLAAYGEERGPQELWQFIHSAEADYAAAFACLEPETAARWKQRCAMAKRHGVGSEQGPGGGAWCLPPPLDEAAARRRRGGL